MHKKHDFITTELFKLYNIQCIEMSQSKFYMGMPKRVFTSYVARDIPVKAIRESVPEHLRKFILERHEVEIMCPRIIGAPVCAAHEERMEIGKVIDSTIVASKTNPENVDWLAKSELNTDTDPAAQDAAAFIDCGYTRETSLQHRPRNLEVIEYTICERGARDGAHIVDGFIPISDASKFQMYKLKYDTIKASRDTVRAHKPRTQDPEVVRAILESTTTTMATPEVPPPTTTTTTTTTTVSAAAPVAPGGGLPAIPQLGLFAPPQPPQISHLPGSGAFASTLLALGGASDILDKDKKTPNAFNTSNGAGGMSKLSSPPAAAAAPNAAAAPSSFPPPPVPPPQSDAPTDMATGDDGDSTPPSGDPLDAHHSAVSKAVGSNHTLSKKVRTELMDSFSAMNNALSAKDNELKQLRDQLAAVSKSTPSTPTASGKAAEHNAIQFNAIRANQANGITPPGTADRTMAEIQAGSLEHAKALAAAYHTEMARVAAAATPAAMPPWMAPRDPVFDAKFAAFNKLKGAVSTHNVPPNTSHSVPLAPHTTTAPTTTAAASTSPMAAAPQYFKGPDGKIWQLAPVASLSSAAAPAPPPPPPPAAPTSMFHGFTPLIPTDAHPPAPAAAAPPAMAAEQTVAAHYPTAPPTPYPGEGMISAASGLISGRRVQLSDGSDYKHDVVKASAVAKTYNPSMFSGRTATGSTGWEHERLFNGSTSSGGSDGGWREEEQRAVAAMAREVPFPTPGSSDRSMRLGLGSLRSNSRGGGDTVTVTQGWGGAITLPLLNQYDKPIPIGWANEIRSGNGSIGGPINQLLPERLFRGSNVGSLKRGLAAA